MSMRTLSVAVVLASGLAAAPGAPASAGLYTGMRAADAAPQANLLLLADGRSYLHCHNMPRRMRCHKTGRLPVNWPPNTDTPGRSSLRESHPEKTASDSNASRGWPCKR